MNKDERYEELYEIAVGRFLDKVDFDASEWLDEGEGLEYEYYNVIEQGDEEIVQNVLESIEEYNLKCKEEDKIVLLV